MSLCRQSVRQAIRHALSSPHVWQTASMFGSMTFLFRFFYSLFQLLASTPIALSQSASALDGSDTPAEEAVSRQYRLRTLHASLAGAIAGLAVLWQSDLADRKSLSQQILLRGLQAQYRVQAAKYPFLNIRHGSLIVFSISSVHQKEGSKRLFLRRIDARKSCLHGPYTQSPCRTDTRRGSQRLGVGGPVRSPALCRLFTMPINSIQTRSKSFLIRSRPLSDRQLKIDCNSALSSTRLPEVILDLPLFHGESSSSRLDCGLT